MKKSTVKKTSPTKREYTIETRKEKDGVNLKMVAWKAGKVIDTDGLAQMNYSNRDAFEYALWAFIKEIAERAYGPKKKK